MHREGVQCDIALIPAHFMRLVDLILKGHHSAASKWSRELPSLQQVIGANFGYFKISQFITLLEPRVAAYSAHVIFG